MKITKELQGLSAAELQNRLQEFKKELLKLRVEVGAGTGTKSSGKVKQTKKNVARVLTVIRQKGEHSQ